LGHVTTADRTVVVYCRASDAKPIRVPADTKSNFRVAAQEPAEMSIKCMICCLLICCFIVVFSGCALAPSSVVKQGTRRSAALQLPLAQASACIQRNSEERSALYTANERQLPDGTLEVVIRFTPFIGALAVARLYAEDGGSAVEVWVAPHVLVDAGTLTNDFLKGC
jgi:hypothetical protein